jgi:CRP/FNR family transcriptional regulator, cyclic AMP receptor protein
MQDSGPVERDRLFARYGRRFSKGDVIFREGDDAPEGYLLQEGRIRLVRRVRGIERSLMVLRPNELFGETALLDGARRTSTALALTEGSTLALDQTTFRRLLETSPSIALRVVQQLVRRLRDAEDQIETMMLRDTQSKIVNALIKLAQAANPTDRSSLLAISPLDLSTRVGLDVDTVRRGVQQLRDGQYVRVVDEHIEIPDLEALGRLYALLALKEEIRGSDSSPPSPAGGVSGPT